MRFLKKQLVCFSKLEKYLHANEADGKYFSKKINPKR
jgi:hypothetical protein